MVIVIVTVIVTVTMTVLVTVTVTAVHKCRRQHHAFDLGTCLRLHSVRCPVTLAHGKFHWCFIRKIQ